MLGWVGKLIDRLFALVGAFLFLQAPLFINSYTQQLAGHVAELQIQVDSMKKVGAQSQKTLEQYIGKFLTSSDQDFNLQGKLMQEMMSRWEQFNEALASLQQSTLWERPFAFVKHFNWNIAKATLKSYEIGIPLTLEASAYACIGLVAGILCFWVIKKTVKLVFLPCKKIFPWKFLSKSKSNLFLV